MSLPIRRNKRTRYASSYFDELVDGSRRSAQVIVPMVLDLGPIGSVIDVGCGLGAWLAEFVRHGVLDIVGVDGHDLDRTTLLFDERNFKHADLTAPLRLGRTFDLVLSVEVAEHLSPTAAEGFVDSLSAHGDAVLFSAAVPGQMGRGHQNENWPSYWAELFARHGYELFDPFRKSLWHTPEVEYWYKQNLVLYARSDAAARLVARGLAPATDTDMINIAHPELVRHLLDPKLSQRLRALPTAIRRSVESRLQRGD